MAAELPQWPNVLAHDHRLTKAVDLFIDESGPRENGTLALGILVVEAGLSDAARDFLNWLASELEADHPTLLSPKYASEWKGRLLARATASKRERRAVGRGEVLSDRSRQIIYARCLDAISRLPGARAFALTYRWTGDVRGPDEQEGYRMRRAVQLALSALTFQVVDMRHAYIDDGHATHYSAAIAEYASRTGYGPIPHTFVSSTADRRIQIADLIAFAAHTSRFPGGSRVFASAHGWLDGFVGDRVIRAGQAVDHHVTEA